MTMTILKGGALRMLAILGMLAVVLVAACGGAGTEAAVETTTIQSTGTSTSVASTSTSVASTSTTTSTTIPPATTTVLAANADGWGRVPHDETVFGGSKYQTMWSVVAGGPGLVAVGNNSSGGRWDAAVWTSPDGLTWARVPHDEAVFGGNNDQGIWSMVAVGSELVAVG